MIMNKPLILFATIATLALALVEAGCGADDAAAPGPTSRAQASKVTDESCSSQSTSVVRETSPVGTCATSAECRFSTPAGLELCKKPGAMFAPSTPSEWHCTCPNGEWKCEITQGAYGMMTCPGYDPDAGDPSDAGHDAKSSDAATD